MPPKQAPKSAAPKAGAGGDKGEKSVNSTAGKPTTPMENQLYANDYTNKLRDQLKKQLQGTKGFPEKLKLVSCFHKENSRCTEDQ
jgi:hypothetical protein